MNLGLIVNISAPAILLLSVLWAIVFKKHAVMRLVCVIIRAVLAFIGAMLLKSSIAASGDSIKAFIGSDNAFGQLVFGSPALCDLALGLTSSLLSLLVFTLLYFILGIVMFLVRMIACIILRKKTKRASVITRSVCGLLQGFVILTCILIPISTYASIGNSALDAVKAVSDTDVSDISEPVSQINDSLVIKAHRILGGDFISGSLSTFEVKVGDKTESIKATTELNALFNIVTDAAPLVKTPMASYTDKELDVLNGLGDSVAKSKLIAIALSEVIGSATEAWDNGTAYMGIEKPSLDPTLDPLIFKSISIIESDASNAKYLKEDINTLAKIISKMITAAKQSGSEGELNLGNALMADGFVRELLNIVNANPRMRPLIPAITNIGLSIISDSVGIDADAEESYGRLTEAIATELRASASEPNADVRQKKMQLALSNALTDLSITDIGDTEITIIAMSVLSYFDGDTNKSPASVTADDVATFLDQMTSAINTNGTSLISSICTIQGNSALNTEQKEEQIASLIAQSQLFTSSELSHEMLSQIKTSIISSASRDALASANALKTTGGLTPNEEYTVFIYTKKSILIDESVINSEIPEQSATALANAVGNAFSSIMSSSQNTSGSISDICKGLGMLLDTFAANESIYGTNKTEHLLKTLLFSPGIKDVTNLSASDVNRILNARTQNNVSYTALLSTVAETSNTLSSMKDGTTLSNSSVEMLVDALMKENAGSVISPMITPEKLVELGYSEQSPEQLESASSLLRAIIDNISHSAAENNSAETTAIKNVISIATLANGTSENGGDAFGADGRVGITADEMVDSFLASSSVKQALIETEMVENPFGIELSESDSTAAIDAISTKLLTADEETAKALNSLALLLGVQL